MWRDETRMDRVNFLFESIRVSLRCMETHRDIRLWGNSFATHLDQIEERLDELREVTRIKIEKTEKETIVDIGRSGKEARAEIQGFGEEIRPSMQKLSQMITRSHHATKEELIEMLE